MGRSNGANRATRRALGLASSSHAQERAREVLFDDRCHHHTKAGITVTRRDGRACTFAMQIELVWRTSGNHLLHNPASITRVRDAAK